MSSKRAITGDISFEDQFARSGPGNLTPEEKSRLGKRIPSVSRSAAEGNPASSRDWAGFGPGVPEGYDPKLDVSSPLYDPTVDPASPLYIPIEEDEPSEIIRFPEDEPVEDIYEEPDEKEPDEEEPDEKEPDEEEPILAPPIKIKTPIRRPVGLQPTSNEDELPPLLRNKRRIQKRKQDRSSLIGQFDPLFRRVPQTLNRTYEDLINNANVNYSIQKNLF